MHHIWCFGSTNPSRLGSCMTDHESIFRILQEVENYCTTVEDLQSVDEVLLRIDAIIDVVERMLDALEQPSNWTSGRDILS